MFTNSKKSEFAYAIEPEAAVYQMHDRRGKSNVYAIILEIWINYSITRIKLGSVVWFDVVNSMA